ncbi:anther-specific protein SF18-like protein [Tanacetum coccineum]
MREVTSSSLSMGVFLQGGNLWGSALYMRRFEAGRDYLLEITTVQGKICEKPSKTWFGTCKDTEKCDKRCIDWEGAKHGACHQRESKYMCFCYFDCDPKKNPGPPPGAPPTPPGGGGDNGGGGGDGGGGGGGGEGGGGGGGGEGGGGGGEGQPPPS